MSIDRPEQVITIAPDASVTRAATMMRDHRIGCLIVTDDHGRFLGIITERDIVHSVIGNCGDPGGTRVKDVMTADAVFSPVGTPLSAVQQIMSRREIRHLPLVQSGVAVEVVSCREVMAHQNATDRAMRDLTIFALAKLAESRDPETGGHLERVRGYARVLADELSGDESYADEIDPAFVHLIYATSPLHDVGKVGIPDNVLLKPGRLDDREFGVMKTHTSLGAQTLDLALDRYPQADFLRMAREIAAHHHERVDGDGYPDGLAGSDIPACARIFAVADVYDALVSRRVYKEACSHDVARDIILEGSGSQFDPPVIHAFQRRENDFHAIRDEFDESREAA